MMRSDAATRPMGLPPAATRRLRPLSALRVCGIADAVLDELVFSVCGHLPEGIDLTNDIDVTDLGHDDVVGAQLGRRFDFIAIDGCWVVGRDPAVRRAFLHACAQHLLPNGLLVAQRPPMSADAGWSRADYDAACAECDLRRVDGVSTVSRSPVVLHQRSARFNVHDLVDEARAMITRLTPAELSVRLGAPARPTVIDTRTNTDRGRFGTIEHSLHVPRTVLEWHLDPSNGYCHRDVRGFDQEIVVVCNGGYSSSVAAANLIRIGFTDVSDLIGGIAAWRVAGLPLVAPTHSHLDC